MFPADEINKLKDKETLHINPVVVSLQLVKQKSRYNK